MVHFEELGVDPLFPGSGPAYKCQGFFLNDAHGGQEARNWLDKTFEAREDDTFVVSFPKTGTTWAQEMVYVIANDLNFEKAKATPLAERFPYMEIKLTSLGMFNLDQPSPRFIKSHYPYSLLPKSILDKKCKLVYTIRNPKDTLVSYYHFAVKNKLFSYQGDFKTFLKLFIEEDRILCSPFSRHVLEFWERRREDNILILKYEDMKKDMSPAVRSVANFMGKHLSDDQVQQVVEHCSFESMSTNTATNYTKFMENFMRKGQVGDWKNYFTDEMSKQMDDYIERHFGGTGLKFDCD